LLEMHSGHIVGIKMWYSKPQTWNISLTNHAIKNRFKIIYGTLLSTRFTTTQANKQALYIHSERIEKGREMGDWFIKQNHPPEILL